MTEWRKIEGHDGYEISVEGVRSYWERGRWKKRIEIPKMLKLSTNTNGYLYLMLGIGHKYRFHRLLAEAFIPNPENKPFIDHINRNRLDNRLENLRWVDLVENNENKGIQSNNKLGHQHICIDKRRGTYVFQIKRNGIKHFKTGFKTIEEAEAYKNQYLMM